MHEATRECARRLPLFLALYVTACGGSASSALIGDAGVDAVQADADSDAAVTDRSKADAATLADAGDGGGNECVAHGDVCAATSCPGDQPESPFSCGGGAGLVCCPAPSTNGHDAGAEDAGSNACTAQGGECIATSATCPSGWAQFSNASCGTAGEQCCMELGTH